MCMGFYSNYTWFPDFLRHWREVNATAHVCIVSDAKQHSLEALHKGDIDICLLPFEPVQPNLLSVKLFQDELMLITQPLSALEELEYVSSDDLSDAEFLTYTRVAVPNQEHERFLRPENAHPARFLDMESPEVIADLVSAGHGISILSRWAMKNWIDPGLVKTTKITKNGLPISWYAVIRAETISEESLHELIQALEQFFSDQAV